MSTPSGRAPASRDRAAARAARHAAILQAAKEVLLARGVDAATMDEVASRAGTTKRTVYAHVGSKDAMVAAVVDESCRRFLAALPDPASLAADPGDAVAAYCRQVRGHLAWRDALALQRLVLGDLWRTPAHGPRLAAVLDEAERRLVVFLATSGVAHAPQRAAAVLAVLAARTHARALFGAVPVADDAATAGHDDDEARRTARAVVRAITGL